LALILGIETSCDDTSISVIRGADELSLVTQTHLEGVAEFGGIVPEIASRQHIAAITPVYDAALARAEIRAAELDALATGLDIPLLAVNHMEAHVYACWIGRDPDQLPELPAVCLVVSGGHTDLTVLREDGRHYLLGRTRDDAAGEAFDKVARVLALGFPGGPVIEAAASELDPADGDAYVLPRARLEGTHDFSFSGLKTAVYRACSGKLGPSEEERIFRGEPSDPLQAREPSAIRRMAAGFQSAIIDVLVSKTALAAEESAARSVILAGGVAANTSLRHALAARIEVPLFMPRIAHCMDNGAMIAMAGSFLLERGEHAADTLDIDPGLELATDSHLPD
jgi:N6-L-threonylcarbamoyladenine synthase